MGIKIKPRYSTQTPEDEQKEFETGIESSEYESAVRISRQPNDKRGHNEKISFRILPYYTRLACELMVREPRFRTLSDFWRTTVNLGCKTILQELKAKGKVGSQFDDLFLILDELEKEMNADHAYRHFERVLRSIPKSLELYKTDREAFKKRVQQLKKKIEGLEDPFWKDRLAKKLKQALSSLDDGLQDDDFQSGDFGWKEDE